MSKGFNCTNCGKYHAYSMYVFAHTRDPLAHKCSCGQEHTILALHATPSGPKPEAK